MGMSRDDYRKLAVVVKELDAEYRRQFGIEGVGLALARKLAAVMGGCNRKFDRQKFFEACGGGEL